MLEVYATQEALETLVGSRRLMPRWDKLLRVDSFVRIYVDADAETLNQLMLDNDIDLEEDSEGVMRKIHSSREDVVLNHPVSIYFPALKKQAAENIQDQFGVICQGEDNIVDDDLLSKIHKTVHLGTRSHDWREILSVLKNMPSNALLINDQYLFSRGREGADGKIAFPGMRNLRNILDVLLPATFDAKTAYHVIVVINAECVKYNPFEKRTLKNCPFTVISKMIKEEIRSLRHYSTPIQVEVMSVDTSTNNKEECRLVHDRYILTNYALIDCTHAFDAFDDNGEATYPQDVHVKTIFGEGIDDDSDMPIETTDDYRKKFHKYSFRSSPYTINGKQEPFTGIKNRLIQNNSEE